MSRLVFIVFLICAGYFLYDTRGEKENPEIIENPIFLETRVMLDLPELSREMESVFVVRMSSEEDCQNRNNYVLDNLIKKCTRCQVKVASCKQTLSTRYNNLFDDKPSQTTYLSLDRGNRFERTGRMIIWGLTQQEAKLVCETTKQEIKKNYNGDAKCILGDVS